MDMTALSSINTHKTPTISLFDALNKLKDPRKKRGIRHGFHPILKLVLLGFCSRLVCLEHIVEFASGCWDQIKEPLCFTRDNPPDTITIGRVLKKVDRKELEVIFQEWVFNKVQGKEMNASVDGKALRNVCDDKGNPIYMINVFAHDIQMVLAQIEIPNKKGESTVLRDHLKALFDRYPGLRLLTGDAAFNGRDLCKEITYLGRNYLVQIKGNQKKIHEVLKLHFDEEEKKRKADAIVEEKKSHWPENNS